MKARPISNRPGLTLPLFIVLLLLSMRGLPALADCITSDDAIATDRPTFANFSPAVPESSLQIENGAAISRSGANSTVDLPETRLRLGLGSCTELLLDLPELVHINGANGFTGSSDLGPAIKHQFSPVLGGLTLEVIGGVFVNNGDKRLTGRGPAPYLQIPWSYDLAENWTLNGMVSDITHPRDAHDHDQLELTLYVDRTINNRLDLYAEYANDTQRDGPTLNRLSIGASYQLTPTRIVDIKIGAGLNAESPRYYVGIGYSIRFDRL